MTEVLKPCPLCGGVAERVDIPAENECDPHAGSSFIHCTACDASSALHADRKENLVSSWNDRVNDVDREREVISDKAREYAEHYPPHSDGRNTFVILAEWIDARKATP